MPVDPPSSPSDAEVPLSEPLHSDLLHRAERDPALEEAINWFVRHDAGALTSEEQADFEAWLGADPQNEAAYGTIRQLWSDLDEVPVADKPNALPAQPHDGKPKTIVPLQGSRKRKRIWQAACALAAGMALFFIALGSDLPIRMQADALTAVGEIKAVTLPDGSTALLNTDSAIAIDYSAGQRRIRLLSGEAEFSVAADSDRPFQVAADGGVSTALGTVFLVRRHNTETTVTVLESRVAVALDNAGGGHHEALLTANRQVAYSEGRGIGPLQTVDPITATAWQRGKLIFADVTLGTVIEELNRYHPGKIMIGEQRLRDMKVNGVFETRDPVAVVNALEASLGLGSTRLTDLLILLHS